MKQTRPIFTHDFLLSRVRKSFEQSLAVAGYQGEGSALPLQDFLMAALAVFTFKYPSLLKFDQNRHLLQENLERLFGLKKAPCDTYMRERLDDVDPDVCRGAFKDIFRLLQRGKVLEHFTFEGHYLVSADGTGMFSSSKIHCLNCCVKEHRNGTKTYHHMGLTAALVHPDQKVVFPLAYEPILKQDGVEKNDCEQNALKRWLTSFRQDHPHLNVIMLLDGLHARVPTLKALEDHGCRYMIVCKEADHKYLYDWLNNADASDAPLFERVDPKGNTTTYQYMKSVPLNGQKGAPKVTVIRMVEGRTGKVPITRVWITNLDVNQQNIGSLVKGARTRWKIENETHNTLKNQGYAFEHNFGHGNKYLHQVFGHLMMLAFLIDQCLQHLNKRFDEALKHCFGKKALWERMLGALHTYVIPDFETLYEAIVSPPKVYLQPLQKKCP